MDVLSQAFRNPSPSSVVDPGIVLAQFRPVRCKVMSAGELLDDYV